VTEQEQQLLLEIADDELILGWRDSEWTGIAPLLEEDVAFSSIAQNEIGHARALYELAHASAARPRTSWPSTARSTSIAARRCVELRLLDWGQTTRGTSCTRRRMRSGWTRSNVPTIRRSPGSQRRSTARGYHRIHAQMWFDRLQASLASRPRFDALRPQAAALLDSDLRGEHTSELRSSGRK